MATGSGIAAQLGAKKETTYGTFVTPTEFFEFDSESLERQPDYLSSTGLRAGRMSPPVLRHRETTRAASGSVSLKVPNVGFGRWLWMLHGNTITPVQQAATAAYLQTHNVGLTSPVGKALSLQVGKPDTGGTVRPFSYVGSKVVSAEFSCDTGEELMFTAEIDAKDEDTAQSLATASYASGVTSFDFTQGTVTIGGSSVALVRNFNLTIPLPQKVDRYGLGAGALKAEPIANDYLGPTGTMTLEFADLAAFNLYKNSTSSAVVCDFQGATIASSYKEQIKFTLAATKFVGSSPQVGGPDVLEIEVPFEVYDDGTNPPVKIEYQSTDVTAL